MARYGYDLHGVIDKRVDFYLGYFETLIKEGNEIWVVSGPPAEQIKKELANLGFKEKQHFTGIVSVVDFLKAQDAKMWTDYKDTWWASDEDWWSAKAKICQKYEVEVMFDDKGRYAPYFDAIGIKFELI